MYAPVVKRASARKETPVSEWSVRITPVNQERITADEFNGSGLNECEHLIVCEEGAPNGTPRLHYHLYIKSKFSRSTLERMCAKLGRANSLVKGNAVFSITKPHDKTIGYVVKDSNIITSAGYTQPTLDEFIRQSKNYRTSVETERRTGNKKKEQIFKNLFNEIIEYDGYDDIIEQILQKCYKHNIGFPSKTTMESNVLRLMYKKNPRYVLAFYSRNFEPRH